MASFEDGGRQCRLPGVPGCRINVVSWRWMAAAIVESTKTYANSLSHRSLFVRLFVLRQVKSKEFAQVVFLLPFRFCFSAPPGEGDADARSQQEQQRSRVRKPVSRANYSPIPRSITFAAVRDWLADNERRFPPTIFCFTAGNYGSNRKQIKRLPGTASFFASIKTTRKCTFRSL